MEQVIKDLQERKRKGLETYGVPLQAFNGRNSVQDFYEEELDKILYCRQWLIEREEMLKVIEYYSDKSNGAKAQKFLKKYVKD